MISPPFTLTRKVKKFKLIHFIHHTLQGLNMTKIKYPSGNGVFKGKIAPPRCPYFLIKIDDLLSKYCILKKNTKTTLTERKR